MTAASSRTPRTPYEPRHERTTWGHGGYSDSFWAMRAQLCDNRAHGIGSPRHAADSHTPSECTVPAIVERVR